MRFYRVRQACLVVLVGLIPFAAFAYQREMNWQEEWAAMLVVAAAGVAFVAALTVAHDLTSPGERSR
jgi:hypothetical protein